MSAFPHAHPRSGPQEPPFLKQNTLPTQDRDLRFLNHRSPNHTGPVYPGDPHACGQFIQPPPQIDMPPYRGQLPPVRPHYVPRHQQQQNLQRQVSLQLFNYASSATAASVESPQAPELPPKPNSGLQAQQQQHPQQQQQQHQQHQHPQQQQQQQQHITDPYAPPPLPARPMHQLAVEAVPPHREPPSPEKRSTSGRYNGADPGLTAQLEELSRDPGAVAEKLKRVAEVLIAFPRKYEAAIQGKTKLLQESILLGQQDLRLLREELQRARSSLVTSQTDTHALMGEMQVLRQENLQLKQAGSLPEPCYTDEETQLLIADLRSQIANLKSEVPDPNLCESLRLMIKLLEEDRKAVEKKYTQVSDELHNRDNEISRLLKEHEASGNFIQEGRTGLEKHFNAQMEELRRERGSLRQQLEIAEQKLEVSQRREVAEHEPGPSRVELQGVIETANGFREQLQGRIRDRDEEITRLKKQLVDSRQVISSSYTGSDPSSSPYSGSESEARISEEMLGLQIENRNLDREVRELRKRSGAEGETERLERELAGERERVRRCERLVEEKEAELQLLASADHGHKDSEKDDMIETLLGTKASLSHAVQELNVKLEDQKQLKNEIVVLRNWLEGRDRHIQQTNDSMSQQIKELDYYKRLADEYVKRYNGTMDYYNKLKEDLAKSDNSLQWFKQRARDLETKQSSTPDFNTAKEVYDAHVEQLTQEIEALRADKKKADSACSERETQIKRLERDLKDLSVEFAQLKNERHQPMAPYPQNMYYMQDPPGAARIPEPYNVPRLPPSREYGQGRDTGVAYPNPKK